MSVGAVEACRKLIEAYDRGRVCESVAWEDLDDAYHAALAAVESGGQATMVVEVRGGLVQEIYASSGVRPIVIDWDTEGADESELTAGAVACQWDRVALLDDLPPDTRAVVDGLRQERSDAPAAARTRGRDRIHGRPGAIRWRCTTHDDEVSTTDISTRGDILTLLESGWPICPSCGADMEPLDDENANG